MNFHLPDEPSPKNRGPEPQLVHVEDFPSLPGGLRTQYRWLNVGQWWYGQRKENHPS